MAARMLVLFCGMLLVCCCCCTQSAPAAVPTPTTWPVRFYALLVQNFTGELAVMNLWYDWGKGGNMHVIQEQLASPYHDMEWTNGTSFWWDGETCTTVEVGVGILRPDWLHDADFLGVKEMTGFTCNVFNKLDFITYYEDVETGKPVYWQFYTGREVHVISFEAGVALSDEKWQAPEYCFSDGQVVVSEKEVYPARRSKSPLLTEFREWMLSGAISA